MEAIRIKDLRKTFGGAVALEQLTLTVTQGEVFGLVGPDGAGKTTTMRLLAGILTPTAGDAWVDNCHIVQEAEALKEHISYMPQRFGLYPDLTVKENINFYADLYNVPSKIRQDRMKELLTFSNMAPFSGRLARNLSGGMKQKLAVACALIHTPRILLLDEPTNGVDPVSRRDLWRILYQLRKENVTIFVSTAYLDEAERCTRIGLLHQGRLLACGTPDEVKRGMQGVLLELRCEQPRNRMPQLADAIRPLSQGLFGDKIHMVLPDSPASALSAAQMAMKALNIEGEIRIINPSLEDVFISMLAPSGKKG